MTESLVKKLIVHGFILFKMLILKCRLEAKEKQRPTLNTY